ncbi:MAG: carbohydrate porin, partial [Planctomycetota bacterium]|nr:carbohydrate porin [Planctomycetota bacterium]
WSNAIAFQVQGHLTSQLGAWVQGGWSDRNMSSTNAGVSVGLGIERPFGRGDDLFGVAYNWSRPTTKTTTSSKLTFVGLAYNNLFRPTPTTPPSRPQSLVEAFYRIQLTDSMQLTPDIQFVLDPSTRSDTDSVVVVGLRLTTDF